MNICINTLHKGDNDDDDDDDDNNNFENSISKTAHYLYVPLNQKFYFYSRNFIICCVISLVVLNVINWTVTC
jgi:hypothetical protein